MKRPAFQFYPKDWKSNKKLRRCSEAARGAWIDILCTLHDSDESEEYGIARFTLAELASTAGVTLKSARELVEKGVLKGGDRDVPAFIYVPTHAGKKLAPVTLIPDSKGPCWYSSRMVKDEWLRGRRGESTRFSTDHQPPRGDPPKPIPKASPTRRLGEPQGDGAAVASAVAVPVTTAFPVLETSRPEPTPAGGESNPEPPDDSRIGPLSTLLARAKVADWKTSKPLMERWLSTATDSQIIRAVEEACRSVSGQTINTAGYIDPILKRIVDQDRKTREASEARVERTRQQAEDQRRAAETAVAMPDHVRAQLPRRAVGE